MRARVHTHACKGPFRLRTHLIQSSILVFPNPHCTFESLEELLKNTDVQAPAQTTI